MFTRQLVFIAIRGDISVTILLCSKQTHFIYNWILTKKYQSFNNASLRYILHLWLVFKNKPQQITCRTCREILDDLSTPPPSRPIYYPIYQVAFNKHLLSILINNKCTDIYYTIYFWFWSIRLHLTIYQQFLIYSIIHRLCLYVHSCQLSPHSPSFSFISFYYTAEIACSCSTQQKFSEILYRTLSNNIIVHHTSI